MGSWMPDSNEQNRHPDVMNRTCEPLQVCELHGGEQQLLRSITIIRSENCEDENEDALGLTSCDTTEVPVVSWQVSE